jgi:uncharacterized protein (TIGR02145 family)
MLKYLFLFICITTTLQAQIMLPAFQAVQYKNSGILIPSVTIGTQNWMPQNLDVATYRDGTPIPQVTDPAAWANLTTGAWCYYNNDPANGLIYGKLYNWYAVAGIHDNDPNTPNKILAPIAYHVPSQAEWTTLINYLNVPPSYRAGGKMKEAGIAHWSSPNIDGTNTSGFTALPGGQCSTTGLFTVIGTTGYWWGTTQHATLAAASYLYLYSRNGDANNAEVAYKLYGFSVRCIKD